MICSAWTNTWNIGNKFNIYGDNGTCSFKKATFGEDNKKPILTYTGKSVYGVLEGSEIIDFTNRCSAYDAIDKEIPAAKKLGFKVVTSGEVDYAKLPYTLFVK